MANSDKQRNRELDKKRKDKAAKRKKEELRKAQAISRQRRNYVRRQITPHYESFRKFKDKHVLIVLRDTDNMEKVLFQEHDLGKGLTLLALPVINEEMIKSYTERIPEDVSENAALPADKNEGINALAEQFFGVRAGEVIDIPEANMIALRECEQRTPQKGMVALNVRPYNAYTWYEGDAVTVDRFRAYSGNKLKTFFNNYKGDPSKTYVFHDSLAEILVYRALRGKVKMDDVRLEHTMYGRKGYINASPYDLLFLGRNEQIDLINRFKNEGQEKQELDGEDGVGDGR